MVVVVEAVAAAVVAKAKPKLRNAKLQVLSLTPSKCETAQLDMGLSEN